MPKGLVGYQQTGNQHFVTFSCDQRRPLLEEAAARALLEQSLETMRQQYDFLVIGSVVMPEPVHLLIRESQ
ncbi:MAG TPA: hypothetical protein VME68_13070 [Acidobacteriaceae bacterium]|nr:hypothetical protein [Acidobacteriaceae bacterium]